MKPLLVPLCIFVSLTTVGAPFQNLGFDEGTTNNVNGGLLPGTGIGPISDLLPGWKLFDGRRQLSSLGFNQITAGLDYASLYDTNVSLQLGYTYPVYGKYSLGIVPGIDQSGSDIPFRLIQTGDVPADAMTIYFVDFGGPFELRINGTVVPLTYFYPPFVKGAPNVPVNVVGDISAFAGQSVELEFATVRGLDSVHGIDAISFSPQIIPEPTSWLLFGLGGLGLLAGRKIFR